MLGIAVDSLRQMCRHVRLVSDIRSNHDRHEEETSRMNTHRLEFAVTLDEKALALMVDLLTQALNRVQTQPSEPTDFDEKRAARLKASQNVLFAGQKPPTDRGLLLNTRETSRMLRLSEKTLYTLEKTGRMPKAIRIGSAVRWSYEELKAWIAAGCPSQTE